MILQVKIDLMDRKRMHFEITKKKRGKNVFKTYTFILYKNALKSRIYVNWGIPHQIRQFEKI